MAKVIKAWERFIGGISDFRHESLIADAYYFGRSIDVRTDPHHVSILPKTIKESASSVTDLIKWFDSYPTGSEIYAYGGTGNFYKRTSSRVYSLLRTVAGSHGNGMAYNPEDNFIYYTTDKTIGRYGSMSSATPQFVDDFFGSQGGVPLNTNSLDLESGSSQYAYRADTASLSITGDLSIVAQIKPESLPTVGNTMTLVSKWNGSGNLRSYMFDIACVSGYFGDGSDGAKTIAADTTDAPIDSACTGTIATTSLTATNVNFAANQIILIHQTQGTGAGTWMRNKIIGYTAGTITLDQPLNATYTTGSQVLVIKQYTNVTVNSGKTWTAKAWNGTTGGILTFLANGTITVTGSINATGKGFVGGAGHVWYSYCGEGTYGPSIIGNNTTPNGNGASSANNTNPSVAARGSGGGNALPGGNGQWGSVGGNASGSTDLTTITFGGGGSGGAAGTANDRGSGNGGAGGGIIFITAADLVVTGSIVNNGVAGQYGTFDGADGGSGAGGSILIKCQTATLGSGLITATAPSSGYGGVGSVGRVHIDYYTSYTGTTSPTIDALIDSSLVTNTSYQLRLSVSNDGTAYETLARTVDLQVGVWQQVATSWDASASTAEFMLNAVSLGTATGTITSISDNASQFFIGCNKNDAGTAVNFFDGLIDEAKGYAKLRTVSDLLIDLNSQTAVNESGIAFYFKFNGDVNDATSYANNLTASGSPEYSSDVPFPSPTTRLDIDQYATTTGNTYTTPVAISEAATHRKTFTPTKDPQKSIAVLVANAGSGNWTITVHDSLNNVMASKTVTNANMATGYYEFVFSTVWRPLTNFTNEYHFHVTSTANDGTVTTTTSSDLETVSYRTYYQFLVEDEWHAVARFLNFQVILNERYLAKYEATLYEPNKIVFGAGWRARCYGYWMEYIAIGCTRGSNIYDYDQGRIYFWDGYSSTFNFYIDVPEGGINALLGTRGDLYIWAGYRADLLIYQGGNAAKKLKEIPLLSSSDYAEIYPGAVAMWRANPRFGLAGDSDSSDIVKAVYTWGSTNYRYADILTCDHPISTGNYGSTVKIGAIFPYNQELLVAWQDNTSYGVDYINQSNAPYQTASLELMVEDNDMSYKEKQAVQIVATFDPLLTGESINVKCMNEENQTSWDTNADSPEVGDMTIRKILSNSRYFHLRIGVDFLSTGTSPTLKSLTLQTDNNAEEDTIG